ncbi:aspartate carbamoyltransferase catalytic subunit [Deferribacterales bacterium RsTz2092]|nr:aspartate carbamoyltransferase [Deferribacterales bacterium]
MARASLAGRSILDLASLSTDEYSLVLDTARQMRQLMSDDVKKSSILRGKSVVTLFYEASTRTRTSFELAAKYLGADVVNITTSNSSVTKGESLRDTLYTLEAMSFDVIVMRHPVEGTAAFADKVVKPIIMNAGDGAHAHPTQGLLDMFTIKTHKGSFSGLKLAILGDITYSRVARSNIAGLSKLGVEIHVAGPKPLIPKFVDELGVKVHNRVEDAIMDADVIDILRIQLERQKVGLFPTSREYARIFGINNGRLKLAKPDVLILHPGPINRGLEISPEVAYGDKSAIREEVQNGVAIRMALLALTLGGAK